MVEMVLADCGMWNSVWRDKTERKLEVGRVPVMYTVKRARIICLMKMHPVPEFIYRIYFSLKTS
jgi:hypothetical protein